MLVTDRVLVSAGYNLKSSEDLSIEIRLSICNIQRLIVGLNWIPFSKNHLS